MNRILLLIGASGSGKSTVARYLCEQYGLRQIDSYTTRPPRYRGESGHIFITDEEFDQLQDFVGYTLYNGHRYGATAQQVEENDIYVIDPAGVEFFRTAYHGDKQVFVVELIVDEEERKRRMLERGDGESKTAERISYDADMFPYSGADLYLTNVDSLRTANAIYQYLTEQE